VIVKRPKGNHSEKERIAAGTNQKKKYRHYDEKEGHSLV